MRKQKAPGPKDPLAKQPTTADSPFNQAVCIATRVASCPACSKRHDSVLAMLYPPGDLARVDDHPYQATCPDTKTAIWFSLPPQGTCARCGRHLATRDWAENGLFDITHGWTQRWCDCCALEVQLIHAREAAKRVPVIEAQLETVRARHCTPLTEGS